MALAVTVGVLLLGVNAAFGADSVPGEFPPGSSIHPTFDAVNLDGKLCVPDSTVPKTDPDYPYNCGDENMFLKYSVDGGLEWSDAADFGDEDWVVEDASKTNGGGTNPTDPTLPQLPKIMYPGEDITKVGIGTTTPEQALDVAGTIRATGIIGTLGVAGQVGASKVDVSYVDFTRAAVQDLSVSGNSIATNMISTNVVGGNVGALNFLGGNYIGFNIAAVNVLANNLRGANISGGIVEGRTAVYGAQVGRFETREATQTFAAKATGTIWAACPDGDYRVTGCMVKPEVRRFAVIANAYMNDDETRCFMRYYNGGKVADITLQARCFSPSATIPDGSTTEYMVPEFGFTPLDFDIFDNDGNNTPTAMINETGYPLSDVIQAGFNTVDLDPESVPDPLGTMINAEGMLDWFMWPPDGGNGIDTGFTMDLDSSALNGLDTGYMFTQLGFNENTFLDSYMPF